MATKKAPVKKNTKEVEKVIPGRLDKKTLHENLQKHSAKMRGK